MKQTIKHIILVSLLLLGVTASNAKLLANSGQINALQTVKNVYKPNELVSVTIDTALSGNKDWVGLYPKDADNSGGKVIAWNFVEQGTTELFKIRKDMPVGAYEVRLFFNNSYDIEQTFAFAVSGEAKKYPKTSTYYKRATDEKIPQPTVDNPSFDTEFGTQLSFLKQPDGEYYSAPDYPKIQAWNSDMSLIRLGSRLYDADTLKETAITNALDKHKAYDKLGARYSSSFRWSAKDPNRFYIVNKKYQLVEGKINGADINEKVLYDFKQHGYAQVNMSIGEGNIDFNDHYIALPVQKLNDNRIYIFLYDLQKKKPVWNEPKLYDNPKAIWQNTHIPYAIFDWVTVSPSGKYIVINDNERGIIRYDINFRNKKKLQFRGYNSQLVSEAGHGDICYNTTGQEVFVSFVANRGPKGIYSFDLDHPDEEGKRIVNEYRSGGHVSCRNTMHKGWAYITTRQEGYAETYAVKLDGTDKETVQRFFQTHATLGSYDLLGASVSPDGTKVVFANTGGTHIKENIKSFIAQAQDTQKKELKTVKDVYASNALVSVEVNTALSGDRDWVAIYAKNAGNSGSNVIAWNWVTQGTTEISTILKDMPAGEYVVKLFFHNSYHIEATYAFSVEASHAYSYGQMGDAVVEVSKYAQDSRAVVYHPSTWNTRATPVIFFAPGWQGTNHNSYKTLLRFIASHGYSVIYMPDSGSYGSQLEKFDAIVEAFSNKLDTSRMGILGHSSGGGFVFKILEHMNAHSYGQNGRFLCSMDGYFAQFMDKSNMHNLDFTNILFVQFGHDGAATDPRIVLTNYNLLTGEGNDKNYIVLANDNDHGYPSRQNIDTMQGLLKPLDGLMEYTFTEASASHHAIALEGPGKVNPYLNAYQKVLPIGDYQYDCNYANGWHKGIDNHTQSTIDNCGEREIQPN